MFSCKCLFPTVASCLSSQIADEIVKKWDSAGADSHLPLGEHMFLFAIKAAMVALMGDRFRNDKEILEFKHNYDMVLVKKKLLFLLFLTVIYNLEPFAFNIIVM